MCLSSIAFFYCHLLKDIFIESIFGQSNCNFKSSLGHKTNPKPASTFGKTLPQTQLKQSWEQLSGRMLAWHAQSSESNTSATEWWKMVSSQPCFSSCTKPTRTGYVLAHGSGGIDQYPSSPTALHTGLTHLRPRVGSSAPPHRIKRTKWREIKKEHTIIAKVIWCMQGPTFDPQHHTQYSSWEWWHTCSARHLGGWSRGIIWS